MFKILAGFLAWVRALLARLEAQAKEREERERAAWRRAAKREREANSSSGRESGGWSYPSNGPGGRGL